MERLQRVTLMGCSRLVGELFVDWILVAPKLRVKLERLVNT
jgi:hypothetical protein